MCPSYARTRECVLRSHAYALPSPDAEYSSPAAASTASAFVSGSGPTPPRRSACVGLRSSKSGATVPASSCDHRQPRISSSEPVISMSPGAKASE